MLNTRCIQLIFSTELFPAVIDTFKDISLCTDKDISAQASLLTTSKLISATKKLCEYLQSVNIDFKKATNYADSVITVLEQYM